MLLIDSTFHKFKACLQQDEAEHHLIFLPKYQKQIIFVFQELHS